MDRASLITGLAELDEFVPDWRRLAEQRGNPFVTPEWYFATLSGARPMVAVARGEDGSLRGLMPLVEGRWRRLRALRFGGYALGDRFHPVARADQEADVARTCIDALAESGGRRLVIDKGAAESGWLDLTYRDGGSSMRFRRTAVAELPRIDLAGRDWDDYLAGRSSNLRGRIRRMERKLIREHGMSIRVTESVSELDADFATLFALHDARRDELGGSSLDSDARRLELLEFCRAALGHGWLRLRTMECDGVPVASFLGWRLGESYCFYQSGFDPKWGRLSVGLVNLALAIRDALEEGAAEFDLLLGVEQYKQRLADGSREVSSGAICRRFDPASGLTRGEVCARCAVRTARGIRDRVQPDRAR